MSEDRTATDDVQSSDLKVPVSPQDHAQGPSPAPITLVEYADYQCPYSGRAYHVLKALQREMGDQLRLVYRNFPLRDVHPHAQHAAEAAEAAANQGKFWEMHDYLFEHQRALGDENLRHYAELLELDTDSFDRDLAQHRYAERIERDLAGGVQSGVLGTPTFFVNGTLLEGELDQVSVLRTIGGAVAP